MHVEKIINSFMKLQEEFDRLEFDFENEFMDDTYIYNGINVFISKFNLKENTVLIKSCDTRPIIDNSFNLTITVLDFLNIVK